MTSHLFSDAPLVVPPLGVELRAYQQEAIDSLYRWFDGSTGNPLIVLPTGSGKSLVLAGFIHSVLAAFPTERLLVLTHVKELIAQNHAQMLRCWPGAPAGIYSAGLRRREADAPILFAGIQSVHKRAAQIGWVDLVLVDECHLIPADGFGMYRSFLGALSSMNPKLKVIGLTATPFRTDSGSLDKGSDRLFHGIAYTAEVSDLIAQGFLSPVTSKSTKHPVPVAGVHRQGGEFIGKELEAAAMHEGLVRLAVGEIVARASDRKAWLVFCCGVAHAKAVAEEIRSHGIEAACVFGDTKNVERDRVIADFKHGHLRALVSVGVLTTGFDAPHVDMIAVLRPTLSPGLWVQMVGRGLRRSPGKENALVLDFGGNAVRHGPIDAVMIRQPKPSGPTDATFVAAKACPSCATLVATATRQCPDCGYEWPAPAPEHDVRPDDVAEILKSPHPTGGIERWNVQRIDYRRHRKPGKPDSLCVEYRCGFHQNAREWVCFDHPSGSYPRRKAESWWRHHGGTMPAPESVDLALCRIECRELREPSSVTVDVRGEHPEVKGVRFGVDREPGDEQNDGTTNDVNDVNQSPVSDDSIPF